jgi:hypothetical protein
MQRHPCSDMPAPGAGTHDAASSPEADSPPASLPTGRELDFTVGLTCGYQAREYYRSHYPWRLLDAHSNPVGKHCHGHETKVLAWLCDCPHFSTDIAAAWQVVEHVYATTGVWLVVAPWHEGGFVAWDVETSQEHYAMALGATAPEAICRAALQALGVRS